MSLATIAMFGDGPPLGFIIERLCMQSFVDAGHPLVMFSYDSVEGLPEGVERRQTNEKSMQHPIASGREIRDGG